MDVGKGDSGATPGMLLEARRALSRGEIGPLPVIIGIVAIWTVFTIANPRFLSPGNLTNLMLQIAAVGTISVGIVLVLLLGEIDLSVGAVSGFAAATMAVLNVKNGIPAPLAIVSGLAVGAAIGVFNGFLVTRFHIPSFVVTLAGLIGWQGAQLAVLGETGTINLTDEGITALAGTFFPAAVGWIVVVLAVGVYAFIALSARHRRVAAGLSVGPMGLMVGRLVLVGVAVIAAIGVLNADRGLPLAVTIFVGFIVIFDFITKKTRFGRYVFAIGGNAEAARRAGIRVGRIRIAVFALASTMAAAGGLLAASRLLAVNQSSGSGDVLLTAIAGPVIAGTSLFGGRGSVWSALLGALVIGSISNGMDLLAFESSIKFMVTGAVLLVAVIIDATARRRRQTVGRD